MFQRIDFENGDFEMVLLPMKQHHFVAAVRDEMRSLIIPQIGWHPEMEPTLSRYLSIYYHKIAQCLLPSFNPETLTPLSRFRFFIYSEPVELEDIGPAPGLSQLDRLLGYTYQTGKTATTKPLITSGDSVLDLLADLLLVFKSDTQWLMERYPTQTLSQLAVQACKRQDPELQKRLQREADQKLFEKVNAREALRAHYERLGIPVPEDF
jgi:hypothetical protein